MEATSHTAPTVRPPTSHHKKLSKLRCTRQAGHSWRSRDELISDVHLWTISNGRAKAGWPVQTYLVHSLSFQTFFVRTFKIVVDTWKFTMLLLYILWYDWPVFMISPSNEQLQQQLEYTLPKSDWHSWWISKMQSDTWEERYGIKICFTLGKNDTETYGMLQTAFGASCMNRASVFEWHKRFKEGPESVRADERGGSSKEVNTPQLIGQRVRVRVTMLRF